MEAWVIDRQEVYLNSLKGQQVLEALLTDRLSHDRTSDGHSGTGIVQCPPKVASTYLVPLGN